MSKSPVLLIAFNRPDTTERVMEQIKLSKPSRLYIAVDGPRASRPDEKAICDLVKTQTLAQVTWPCEVKTLFREKNLGCKMGVSSAISWFFEHEESGVILEDDCLPHQSFFDFCDELLEKYKEDDRIAMISGDNYAEQFLIAESYGFTRYPHIWGWASWRRVWANYDVGLSQLSDILAKHGTSLFTSKEKPNPKEAALWARNFSEVHQGKIDTWDYQFAFQAFIRRQLSIFPKYNLISNIGFDSRATHTLTETELAQMKTTSLPLPLTHPLKMEAFQKRDAFIFSRYFYGKNIFQKIISRILR